MIEPGSDRSGGSALVTALRIVGRLLRLAAVAAAGAAVTVLVLRALAADPADLPGRSTVIVLCMAAVVAFGMAILFAIVADRAAVRSEREAIEGMRLTPEELEAERLRETPFLARQRRAPHPPLDD